MEIVKINNRVNLLKKNIDKFKTFTIGVLFHGNLNKEEYSLNALLPYVLKQGSMNYPDMKIMYNKLEELYGGTFECDLRKKGEDHIISFEFEFVSPEYIKDNENYYNEVLDFIFDVVFNPYVKNNEFDKEYVKTEKNNLIDYISGIANDKKEYASLRCVEEMCKGDNYALFRYGSKDDICNIDGKKLYSHYKKLLKEKRIDFFVVGTVDENEIIKRIEKLSLEDNEVKYPETELKIKSNSVKEIREKFDVAQGKISLGFTTGIKFDNEKKYALSVFNSLYGSGAHSKLFNNVREKLSLCYYAYSRIDSFKGIMTVNSGVEFKNFKKAYDEILQQLEEVKCGNFTDEEILFSKNSLINSLNSINDNPFSIADYYLRNLITNDNISISEYIDKIKKVTREEIIEVAGNINLDTVYYLEA